MNCNRIWVELVGAELNLPSKKCCSIAVAGRVALQFGQLAIENIASFSCRPLCGHGSVAYQVWPVVTRKVA
jgi:hypothetical protein